MAKVKKQISFEDALWGACDKLRGTVEPAEYKHVVLSLIFLKFVNDKFEARRKELVVDDKTRYTDWAQRIDVKAEMEADLMILLDDNGYPPVPRNEVYNEVFEQAENFKKYAE